MDMRINVGSENWSKLVKNIRVNIDSKMRIESQCWRSGSHSHSSSISLNEKLNNLSRVWNWSSSSLYDEIDSWLKSPGHNDFCSYQYG